MIGNNLEVLLNQASVRKESMVAKGIQFIRKKESDGRSIYFLVNTKKEKFEGWLPLQTKAQSAVLYNPMNAAFGTGKWRRGENEVSEVYVQLAPEQSLIVEMYEQEVEVAPFDYYTTTGITVPLTGEWKITFESGGPVLPASIVTDTLSSWTNFGVTNYSSFSGTATYALSFPKPSQVAEDWLLDLGKVKE